MNSLVGMMGGLGKAFGGLFKKKPKEEPPKTTAHWGAVGWKPKPGKEPPLASGATGYSFTDMFGRKADEDRSRGGFAFNLPSGGGEYPSAMAPSGIGPSVPQAGPTSSFLTPPKPGQNLVEMTVGKALWGINNYPMG